MNANIAPGQKSPARESHRLTTTDETTERCPDCGHRIAHVTQVGRSEFLVSPCGCRVEGDRL